MTLFNCCTMRKPITFGLMRGNWLRHTLGLHQQEIDGKKCVILWVQAFIFEIVLHPLMRRCHLASGAVCRMFFFFLPFFSVIDFLRFWPILPTLNWWKDAYHNFLQSKNFRLLLLSSQQSKKQIIIYCHKWWRKAENKDNIYLSRKKKTCMTEYLATNYLSIY